MPLPFQKPDPEQYKREIADGLTRAYRDRSVEEQPIDVDAARIVVFSDHHRGIRDGADDFQRCERAYNAALAFYRETGYTLMLLGDVEELWENDPDEVIEAYAGTLALESAFHRDGCLERFWGNHDDDWNDKAKTASHLHAAFPGLEVREALKLSVTGDGAQLGELFLLHGHQGTLESERFSWISRIVVRHVWRPLQRKVGFASTTPAIDWELRGRHEEAMFQWAENQRPRPVLVAGHTHRPVFGTSEAPLKIPRGEAEVERELEAARASGDAAQEQLGRLSAELEYIRAEQRRHARKPIDVVPPCYFNTGCCSYGDGDVTGLEIAGGELRLVRWSGDAQQRVVSEVLARKDLREVLAEVRPRA